MRREKSTSLMGSGFCDTVIEGLAGAGVDLEDVEVQLDLDAVYKFLDTAGNKLNYRHYGEVLLEILIAGSPCSWWNHPSRWREGNGPNQGLRLPGRGGSGEGQGLGPGLHQAHAQIQIPREDVVRGDEEDLGVPERIHSGKDVIIVVAIYERHSESAMFHPEPCR